MVDEPDHILLQYMRRFDEKLDRVVADVQEIKVRLTNVEENLTIVHRRLDRMDARIERIEKRLELVDSPYGGVRE
jgi:DNA repair ATPase RecN